MTDDDRSRAHRERMREIKENAGEQVIGAARMVAGVLFGELPEVERIVTAGVEDIQAQRRGEESRPLDERRPPPPLERARDVAAIDVQGEEMPDEPPTTPAAPAPVRRRDRARARAAAAAAAPPSTPPLLEAPRQAVCMDCVDDGEEAKIVRWGNVRAGASTCDRCDLPMHAHERAALVRRKEGAANV